MSGIDFIEWLLDGPLWILAAAAVPVIVYFAVFAAVRRSSARADPPPARSPDPSAERDRRGGN